MKIAQLILLVWMLLVGQNVMARNMNPRDFLGIELCSGEFIELNSLQLKTNVLKSLKKRENIEIMGRVFYPEEITKLIKRGLTNKGIIERSLRNPNQGDYL